MPLGFLFCSQHVLCGFCCKCFVRKFWQDLLIMPLPSLFLDELTMDKRDSGCFFSKRLACRTNDRSYNLTDSTLVTVDYQQRFLALCMCSKTDQACAHVHGHVCDSASSEYQCLNLHICISHMTVMWFMVNGMQNNNYLPAAYMWLQVSCLELIASALAPVQTDPEDLHLLPADLCVHV